mmetsp:Transcript_31423/g.53038  ORF Transcript_31423/g.53038 Transcript_31423/m.53038 type:complete len:211 (+) Transcript_31423:415-1047(+)
MATLISSLMADMLSLNVSIWVRLDTEVSKEGCTPNSLSRSSRMASNEHDLTASCMVPGAPTRRTAPGGGTSMEPSARMTPFASRMTISSTAALEGAHTRICRRLWFALALFPPPPRGLALPPVRDILATGAEGFGNRDCASSSLSSLLGWAEEGGGGGGGGGWSGVRQRCWTRSALSTPKMVFVLPVPGGPCKSVNPTLEEVAHSTMARS